MSFPALLLKRSVMECPYTDAVFLTSCIYDHYLNTQTNSSVFVCFSPGGTTDLGPWSVRIDCVFLSDSSITWFQTPVCYHCLRLSFLLELYTSEMTPAMEPSKSGNWPFTETTMTSCDGNVQGHFYICVPLQFQPIYHFFIPVQRAAEHPLGLGWPWEQFNTIMF